MSSNAVGPARESESTSPEGVGKRPKECKNLENKFGTCVDLLEKLLKWKGDGEAVECNLQPHLHGVRPRSQGRSRARS